MNEAKLAKVLEAIRVEVRTLGLLDVPPDFRPRPPFDLEAEKSVIVAMFAGHRPPVSLQPKDFWLPLHEAVFVALDTAMDQGVELTAERVATIIERLGFRGRDVFEAVRKLADETPFCVHFGRAAGRVARLARQRRARESLARIDAALCDVEADPKRLAGVVAGLRRVAEQLEQVSQ